MPFSIPSLKRMAVAQAIAHPTDDLTKVSAQVRNMSERMNFLEPVPDPSDGRGALLYRPGDCVTAAVAIRLWQAGMTDSNAFHGAVLRLNRWYLTDEFPDWKLGDPDPDTTEPPSPDKPYSPACFVLKDFCETGAGWTLRLDVRRHSVTGEFRFAASLWRTIPEGEPDAGKTVALGNGSPIQDGWEPQSAHVIVLDSLLAQIASSTIYRKKAH